MLLSLILSAIFVAGFFAGYAFRSRRSHKRRAHYLLYAPYRGRPLPKKPYDAKPQGSMFGRVRRAF